MCDFQETFWLKMILFLKKIWFFGSLEVLKLKFKTLRFWFEIWELKSEILRFGILKIKNWNFDHETWGLNFFSLKTGGLKLGKDLVLKKMWIIYLFLFF